MVPVDCPPRLMEMTAPALSARLRALTVNWTSDGCGTVTVWLTVPSL